MTKKIESARDIFSESARETQKVPKKSARDKNCHVHFARDKKCHGEKKTLVLLVATKGFCLRSKAAQIK